ncbi:Brix domain [Trypanosoma vivax]|uniref:Putative RNA processing factor 1 n=1 Tax=Trypanosoma vivax (strain Y486) TaxID=1055687 RepID=G0U9X8_TRYVY|nr:RNA processing factor 1 [Trypanosoma vivax]KAH8619161.1 Brix domain [Trypanosoma vivax]CCC52609.1 putative RNA processing factor 1 [Trypanosoma vivax Y486]
MGRGARTKRTSRPSVKRQGHVLRHRAPEVDPVLLERYRNTRQPVKKSLLFEKLREQNKDAKRFRREAREKERKLLKEDAPAKAIPKTKERMRRPDPTFLESPNDTEILRDEDDDEFASFFKEGRKPTILITTGEHPCYRTRQFVKEALWLFPNSIYRPRKDYTLKEITQFCINRNFTDLIVVTDRIKEPHSLIVSHLPTGPTAMFRLSNFLTHAQLKDPAPRTEHYPELIFKNFSTRLGRRIHRMLECLFPATRDYAGRAVATFHNQRDYIFMRTHRYIFDSLEAVRIQEMGPRFTMRLLSLQSGTFDSQFGEYEWFRKKEHDADKLEWYL